MFRLDNKIAVITGGGSGIGKAIAKLFAKQGAVVHILEWNTDTANETADEIKNDSGRSFVHKCNVADQKEVLAIFESIGVINILVNNAGIAHIGKAAHVGIPYRFAYSTTKGAVMAMTLSVAKDYLQENIRCNSISPARVHTPFVDGFLKNTYPGKEEEMFEKLSKTQPIGRMGTPDEVAALALYLCSDEASFITGCDYLVDGGFVKLNN